MVIVIPNIYVCYIIFIMFDDTFYLRVFTIDITLRKINFLELLLRVNRLETFKITLLE